jgi:amino acid transporter
VFNLDIVKKLLAATSGLIAYALTVTPAFAVGVDPCTSGNTITDALCKFGRSDNWAKAIQNVIIFIIVIAVLIALIYLLYGGIKWITSRGEKAEVEAARNHITAAIVGLIIVFLAIFIVSIVMSLFGLQVGNLQMPNLLLP